MPKTGQLAGGRWRVQWRDPSGRVVSPGGLTFPTKTSARQYGLDREAEIRRGQYHDPTAGRVLLRTWLDEWFEHRVAEPRTLSKMQSHLDLYVLAGVGGARPLGDLRLDQVNELVLQGWVKRLEQTGLAPSSVGGVFTTVKTALRAAGRAGRLQGEPWSEVVLPTVPPPSDFYWEREETDAIREQLTDLRDRALFETLLGTGMRWGEAAGLHLPRWQPLRRRMSVVEVLSEGDGGFARKEYPKGKGRRDLPVAPDLVTVLAAYLAETPPIDCGLHLDRKTGRKLRCPGLVFHDRGHPLSRHVWPRRTFAPAIAAAGAREGSPHDLRHTYASWRVIDGVPLRVVQELLGHASIRTTERYSHLAPSTMDDPRLAASLAGPGVSQKVSQTHVAT